MTPKAEFQLVDGSKGTVYFNGDIEFDGDGLAAGENSAFLAAQRIIAERDRNHPVTLTPDKHGKVLVNGRKVESVDVRAANYTSYTG